MGGSGEGGSSDDPRLRELVLRVLEELDRVGPQALDVACAEHPELAARLRARIAALAELGLAGSAPGGRLPERVGDFRLIEVVGAGGMGVVYRAEQVSLGREVALKLIRPDALHHLNARERFARETAIIARLQHPGIVPIYVVGGAEDLPYYAMELVAGCTLAEALHELRERAPDSIDGAQLWRAVRERTRERGVPLPEGEGETPGPLFAGSWEETCLRVVGQVADALRHAHARGILHRDLKPSNVMVTPGGRVMLLDFGLSLSEGSETMTGSADRIGSLPYMPPELLSDGPRALDVRSDVYSLGVLLYELLTLRPPYRGESVPATMAAILEGRPPRPRAYHPGLSWECETVCLAAFDREPVRRYASAEELANDLSNALHKRPVEARRASFLRRARRWVQRRPAEAAVIVLLVSLPLVALLFLARETRNVSAALNVAEDNRDRAVAAIEAMLVRVGNDELDHVPGLRALRHELIAEASELYGEMLAERPYDLRTALLAGRCKLVRADLCSDEQRLAEAEELGRSGLALLAPFAGAPDFELRLLRARLHAISFRALHDQSRREEASEHMEAALAELEGLRLEHPEDVRALRLRMKLISEQSARRSEAAPTEEGLAALRACVDEMRAEVADSHDEESRDVLALTMNRLGVQLSRLGRTEQAVAVFEEELDLRRELVAAAPDDDRLRHLLAHAADNLAGRRIEQDRYEEAVELLDAGLEELEIVCRDFPEVAEYECSLAELLFNRGVAVGALRRYEEGRSELLRAAEILRGLLERQPEDAHYQRTLGSVLVNVATRCVDLGETDRALATCDEAKALFESALRARPDSLDWRRWLGIEADVRARVLLARDRPAEAAESLIRAAELAAHDPYVLHNVLVRLGRCLDRALAMQDDDRIGACEFAGREVLRVVEAGGRMGSDSACLRMRERLGMDE